MKLLKRLSLLLLGVVAAIAVVVAVRTATRSPPGAATSAVTLAPGVAVDPGRAAAHLSEAVRIRTVSHQDRNDNDRAEFERFLGWLQTTYPAAHQADVARTRCVSTPVYTWPGSDPTQPPFVLMAHYDVVPVTPGTEADWKHPPFDGVIADNAVWGRGTVDDKGTLVAIFEAVEALAATGFNRGAPC